MSTVTESPDDPCAALQAAWRGIPLAAAMGIEAAAFDGETLHVRAPLAANINVHGTAFAGSLFSVCVLAAWGRLWLALHRQGVTARIVVTDSRIDYRRPVTGYIECRSRLEPADERALLDELLAAGRATLPLDAVVPSERGPAVQFTGTYALRLKPRAER
ncbi:MAG TPA: YiiD C-terminal domain-containing protein [Gammaproteobacteria bacterium]